MLGSFCGWQVETKNHVFLNDAEKIMSEQNPSQETGHN